MKRILSVILSLALLASLLIIPMSVSADDSPSYGPTPFSIKEAAKYFNETPDTRVSDGLSPVIFITYKDNGTGNTMRKLYDYAKCVKDVPALSDGNVSVKKDIEGLGDYFKGTSDYTSFTNDYTISNYKNVFNFNSDKITNYVDIIYDLGCTVDVNKIQHFAGDYATSTGLYQVYASVDVNNLFDDESWVLNYQNKEVSTDKYYGCQQHEFAARSARFVAFRILCPVTVPSGNANTLRIYELAIYGTKTSDPVDYTVSTTGLEFGDTGKSGDTLTDGTPNILKNISTDKVTVIGFNGTSSKTFDTNVRTDADDRKKALNDGNCIDHKDFDLVVNFYDTVDGSPVLSNGYNIDRKVNGNITFKREDDNPNDDKYMDFTYDLGDYYKIKQFDLYSCKGQYNILYKTQAYEVYIGNDKDTLYTNKANKVAEYENIFNTSGQKITFNEPKTGKYLGVKILMPAAVKDGGNYPRIAEIAAYGKCVGAPPVIDVAPGETCGSAKLTVTPDKNNSITSVKVNNVEKVTDENKESVKAKYEEPINKGTYTVVATDDKGNETTKEFTVADHNYKYTAKDNVITETCAKGDLEAKTLTLTKPATIVYDGNDKSGSIDAVKIEGFANAAGKGDIVFKKGDKTVTEVKDAGNYVAELTIEGVTARLPFAIEQAKLDSQYYAAPQVPDKEAGTTLGSDAFGANDKGAFTWAKPDTKVEYGSHTYKATFTPTNDNYKTVENIDVTVNGKDTTAPTGTIKIKETVWDKLANLFIKDKETVTITGSDAGSGVDKILYYVTDAEIDDSALANVEWTDYTGSFKIEKEGNNVVYAKIVDVANNKTVINTDCIVLDTTAPVADVTNLGKYYGSLTVTVTEDNLKTVELNDKVVTLEDGKFTVSAADKKQTIVIKDKADNETTYEVTVVEVKGLESVAEELKLSEPVVLTVTNNDETIAPADKEKIAQKIEKKETITYFEINLDKVSGGAITETGDVVLEIPVDFIFTGKVDVRVLHNHGGDVRELEALTARPTADFKDGTFFADTEKGTLYIYSNKFSAFAVAFHVHDVKHIEAKAATAEADGNIEYWYCEGCDKYFSDAAATKEITKESTVVKYVAPSNENTGDSNAPTTGSETENNATVPGGTSPGTGETAMTVVLFAILLGALAVMGISIVKSRKAKSK